MAEEARPFTGEVEIDEPKLAHGACGAGADAEPAARRPSSRPIKRRMSNEDQSEATDWIIFDFSEEEAMARRSA